MSGKLKLLIGGLLLGVLVIFAAIGVKSTLAPRQPEQGADAAATQDWEKPSIMPNANMPSPDLIKDDSVFTRPLDDKPADDDASKVELVNEPKAPDTAEQDTADTDKADTGLPADEITDAPDTAAADKPTDTSPPADEASDTPDKTAADDSASDTPDKTAADDSVQIVDEPAPAEQPTANTGKLEIVAQNEKGKAVKANVYIQKANGANIDKANYTAKAAFNLPPGSYKVTVRAEGYGSLSRNIKVPANAVVNEIFPLPKVAAAPAATPATPPAAQAPVRPAPSAAAGGKLRLAALSADDGSPLQVNFTIARLDGSVVEQVDNVALTEVSLPAQEFVVSFDYNGFHGYKSLTVRSGQTLTHTFNIRGVHHSQAPVMGQMQPPPDMGQIQPSTPPLPMPAQQQPQSMEEMLIQRIQQELDRQMRH